MMRYQPDMLEFIRRKCDAVMEPRKFIHSWIKSSRNPCSICYTDKSKCSYWKDLVDSEVVNQEENST